ncbi:hypothetical protein LCGC14_0354800 [marine sediment metagenome]|uniref:Uncharacterized protein n=1 Tax=marine sediment metagenome TaxID=412755 RepID=A0A0F9T9M3_9ZZZZ
MENGQMFYLGSIMMWTGAFAGPSNGATLTLAVGAFMQMVAAIVLTGSF